ncbi:MAG: GlcNAc-PI de-N-acetylase, partial [Anaerolineaceae bacterium]|nr:GlcNAc-PI de-N-acetylase [Anaerolineaceae bacterium]
NYFHPDHIATHQAAVRAFFAAGQIDENTDTYTPYAPQKLFFHSINFALLRILLRLMPLIGWDPSKFGRNNDIDLKSIANVKFPIHAAIRYRKESKLRDEASSCHRSQGGDRMDQTRFGLLRRLFTASRDTFMQAYPVPLNGKISHDLFAGVNFQDEE